MKTAMERLRADMMTKGVFAWYERRQLRWLSKANQDQHRVVKDALPAGHFLRKLMETCGQIGDWGNMNYCGVPLCPRCHMRERTVQTGKAIKERFVGATNDELAFATILLPPQLDFTCMTKLIENEKRRLRTFIDRQRLKDYRWDDFELLGWWEIDRMSFGDFDSCGRNTQIALESLGFPQMETNDKTIWRPHLHAIVRMGRLTTDEIANALRKETHTAKYQVDIQPFYGHRDVSYNIQNIVRYCLKFRIEADYKRTDAQDFIDDDDRTSTNRNWWPAADILSYVEWLCVGRSSFQSLRVVIGRPKSKPVDVQSVSIMKDIESGVSSTVTTIDDRVGGHVVNEEIDAIATDERRSSEYNTCMYNNIVRDTNWITSTAPSNYPRPPREGNDPQNAMERIEETFRCARDVMSLSERLHSLGLLDRASGSQWSNMAH